MKRVVVTGSGGLLGRHAAVRLFARNRAEEINGRSVPFEIRCVDRDVFESDKKLQSSLVDADAVLHFAGVNRGDPATVKTANPAIAKRLVAACQAVGARPHIVYANSVHADSGTPYGIGKARAADELAGLGSPFTNLILPHVFGEGARPYYNNVTATLIAQLIRGDGSSINPDGRVNLLHAGKVAEICINAATEGKTGRLVPQGLGMSISELYKLLQRLHRTYTDNVFPSLTEEFELSMFNTYRTATYPLGWPRTIKVHADARGLLFEAVKGGGGGQVFLSTTLPGVTRGNHLHLNKVERFLVLQGTARIRIRPVLGAAVHEYAVSGDSPAVVDIPTLFTHSIQNIGNDPLLTLFWTHEQFNPQWPDTFPDRVIN